MPEPLLMPARRRKAPPKPPKHLSRRASAWWRSIASTWELEPHQIELLTAAAGCMDRIEEARVQIAEKGTVFIDKHGQPREHPAARHERDQKLLLAKLCRELNLDPAPTDSRPPLIRGRYVHRD